MEEVFVGRPSSSRLQLRPRSRHTRSSRPDTARKTKFPHVQLPAENKTQDDDMPRASSVPLLWDDVDHHVTLAIHSTPVSLATRSLSTHSTTSMRSSSTLPPSSNNNNNTTTGAQKINQITGTRTRDRRHSKSSGTSRRRGKMAAQFKSVNSQVSSTDTQYSSSGSMRDVEKKIKPAVIIPITPDKMIPVEGEGEVPVIKEHIEISKKMAVEETVDGKEARDAACRMIQQWYRNCQRRASEAHIQKMLREKKAELDHSRSEGLSLSSREDELKKMEQRKQRRQEKMRASRQAAILTLQQRREEKRIEIEKIAQQEIVLLQASGKIERQGREKGRKKKKKVNEVLEREEVVESTTDTDQTIIPTTTQTVPDSIIDEFFEAGSSRKPLPQTTSSKSGVSSKHEPDHIFSSLPTTIPKATSTYADILDTLKLLEEAPPPLPGSKSRETPPTNHESMSGNTTSLSSASLGHHNDMGVVGGVAKQTSSSGLSESKLQSIMSYLDEMEKNDGTAMVSQTRGTSSQTRGTFSLTSVQDEVEMIKKRRDVVCEEQEQMESATAVASDVTATIISQRLEIDNKNKTVEMLQKALKQQRELTVYHAKEMEKEGERRLQLQKQEYETTVQRHQSFIDQLIEDKKTLGERCEKLVKELRETSNKYQIKLKAMEEAHATELSKVKQVAAATDKLRREKWRKEESQRIKHATVHSLEPEIQRIIQKGKADIQRLKSMHEAELLEADERAGRRFVAQMEELRAQCAMEKEQACAHERELARQKYEKLAEQEEMNAQQQRRRLFAELQQERDKMAAQWDLQRIQLEQQQAELQEAHSREIEGLKRDHSMAMKEAERRHVFQLKAVEERLVTEKTMWQENYTQRQETTFFAREREMRDSLRQERDKEIEMIISRLEEEAEATCSQNEKATGAKIKRIREKCEVELAEVERSERSVQEKLTTFKQQLGEREGEMARLKSLLRQKEEEVREVGAVADRLTKERDNVTDVVRQEFADRLVLTEEENKQLKIEMSEQRARHRLELERGQREKEKELDEVHSRVRQALEKKEENMNTLRRQHQAALKRAEHLEMLLERQRKELLKI